jgi:hypothetical protein
MTEILSTGRQIISQPSKYFTDCVWILQVFDLESDLFAKKDILVVI